MMRIRNLGLVVSLAAAVAFMACGNDGGSETDTMQPTDNTMSNDPGQPNDPGSTGNKHQAWGVEWDDT